MWNTGVLCCSLLLIVLAGCGDSKSTSVQSQPARIQQPARNASIDESTADAAIEPVTVPNSIFESTIHDSSVLNTDAVILKRVRALEYTNAGRLKMSEYRTIKILTARGIEKLGSLDFPFDPTYETIALNGLVVRNPDGFINSGNGTSISDEAHRSGVVPRKVLQLSLPDLKPDCTVEFTVTRQLKTRNEIPFFEFAFNDELPVMQDCVLVRGEVNAFRSEASPGLKCDEVDQCRYWSIQRPTGSQSVSDTPTLWLCDARLTWRSEAERYLKMLAGVLAPDAAAQAEAMRLTAGMTTDTEKLKVLATYVQREYPQSETESGVGARIPRKCSEIIQRKCGDCKEQALLLLQLLSAVKIPAHLALVNAIGPVRIGMPTFYQFNHMIVNVHLEDKSLFIDCTDKQNHVPEGGAVGLAGKDAFILDSKNPRFDRIPDSNDQPKFEK